MNFAIFFDNSKFFILDNFDKLGGIFIEACPMMFSVSLFSQLSPLRKQLFKL